MSNVAKLKKRALDYEQKKQFDKALETYTQVLGALGDHVEEGDVALFNRVGDLLLRQGNVSAAVDHYERAVDLYTEGGFHNNAIALCSKILRNAPGRNSIYYKLGRISAKKGFTNDAKHNFLEYADRMQRIGHVEEAFRALKEFADLCPDQDDIRLMLADQLVRGERKEEAIEQLQLLYDKLQAEGRAQEAKATLDRMTAIDPSHQPKTGVLRPTPKANDLIFLDVGFDMPGAPSRSVIDAAPAARAGGGEPVAPAPHSDQPLYGVDQPLPLIQPDDPYVRDGITIAPVEGLSSGAIIDPGAAAGPSGSRELVGGMDAELITGFEETSLGATDEEAGAVLPLDGLEQSTPLSGSGDTAVGLPPDAGASEPHDDRPATDAIGRESEDELSLLDISFDLVDDVSSDSGDGLTLIFPEGDTGAEWNGSAPPGAGIEQSPAPLLSDAARDDAESFSTELPDALGLSVPDTDDLRLEPLLQLPDLDPLEGTVETLGDERDLPLISLEEEPLVRLSGEPESAPIDDDYEPSPSSELRFLDLGGDAPYDHAAVAGLEASEYSPSGAYGFEAAGREDAVLDVPPGSGDPAAAGEPTLADLRAIVELNGDDWVARRQLAEALLEAGDRHGGIAELESAMLGLEGAGDLRGAAVLVNEIIRVEPHVVRYHQKRVEYAVRANDRSALAEAYYSLAENLFQMGEIDKSRAVYARVLELLPGDPRVRAALQAIDADLEDDSTEAAEQPSEPAIARSASFTATATDEAVAAPRLSEEATLPIPEPPEAGAPVEESPLPRPRAAEPAVASENSDFVNLADWLNEDAPERNTRMVVDVKEPEIQEQVDFTEMLAMFKQGVAANVDEADHEAHYDLGVAYKEMGLLDEAISEFQKALRGTENRARTYEALGQCFIERGQHQIAVAILSRALGDKSYTDDMLVGVLYLLGNASETLGRWPDAQRFYERVFAVDIEFRDIAERLAVAERAGK